LEFIDLDSKTDLGLKIIDIQQIGENTPVLWNASIGTGQYQNTKSLIENYKSIKTISTTFEIKDEKKELSRKTFKLL
jgi:hypothetical protein